MATGIGECKIAETPVAVIDFETTGLYPGRDRVVEISVVRCAPGKKPELAFDTLVNPGRSVGATEIHGITDDDVADAPRFEAVVDELLRASSGCVVAAYNVYFDMKFLHEELRRTGRAHSPAHFCLMYLRPMLGLGSRCSLSDACTAHGIAYSGAHIASQDALASAKLLEFYWSELDRRGVATFDELARLKSYKFNESFACDAFPAWEGDDATPTLKSRATRSEPRKPSPLVEYWNALVAVVSDLEVTDEEIEYLIAKRNACALEAGQVRMLHARAFSVAISQMIEDQFLDNRESSKLRRLHDCLARLGWAPGQ